MMSMYGPVCARVLFRVLYLTDIEKLTTKAQQPTTETPRQIVLQLETDRNRFR